MEQGGLDPSPLSSLPYPLHMGPEINMQGTTEVRELSCTLHITTKIEIRTHLVPAPIIRRGVQSSRTRLKAGTTHTTSPVLRSGHRTPNIN